jgi:hypothetical protein
MAICAPRRTYWSSLSLISLTFLFLGAPMPIRAFAAITCDGVLLPPGGSTIDLEVTGNCVVDAGTYIYRNVNIYKRPGATNGGTLTFADADIDFFAESIVIENEGKLIAGSSTTPIGTNGVVTIHLWGKPDDPGATCKTDDQCGVPLTTWDSNAALSMTNPVLNPASCKFPDLPLPGGVKNDCFYAYETLDEADMMAGHKAYFGHKVLALSYGGTLQLFGKKGAIYPSNNISSCADTDPSVQPSCTGTSWLRLNGSLKTFIRPT